LPSRGQRVARADHGLRERGAEAFVDAHDLAGRLHLRAEQRVDAGNLLNGNTGAFTEKYGGAEPLA
jgi:hypothetical protein